MIWLLKGQHLLLLGGEFSTSGVPFLRINNIKNDAIDYEDILYISDDIHNSKLKRSIIKSGDFLITIAGTIGKTLIVPDKTKEMNCNQAIAILRLNDLIDKSYLKYWLQTSDSKNQIRGAKVTGTISNLSLGQIKQLEIPLPPLKEQKRIAAILDKADAIRKKRQRAIELADEFLRSVFLDMFEGEVKSITEKNITLADASFGFQNGIGKGKDYYGKGEKVANIGDLYLSHRFEPKKYSLLDVNDKEIDKYSLRQGDLLFVRSSLKREGVAYCSFFDSDELCLFSSFMIRCRVNNTFFEPEFLAYLLRMPQMRKYLMNASNTATITNISQEGLSSIPLPIIKLKKQKLFLEYLTNMKLTCKKYHITFNSYNVLFNSLSQKAFRGDL